MTRICHCCGAAFDPKAKHPKANFCSTSCATRSRIQRHGTGMRLRRLSHAEDYDMDLMEIQS